VYAILANVVVYALTHQLRHAGFLARHCGI